LARKELIAVVRGALDRLEPIDRQILLLRSDAKLSYREIGQRLELEMDENTVNQRYLRAIKKLGKLLPAPDSFY
jgi:RNA polymerase sigma factor (sigma-70 family)